jgi:hypothetical protein
MGVKGRSAVCKITIVVVKLTHEAVCEFINKLLMQRSLSATTFFMGLGCCLLSSRRTHFISSLAFFLEIFLIKMAFWGREFARLDLTQDKQATSTFFCWHFSLRCARRMKRTISVARG